jgi:hypothetical protein
MNRRSLEGVALLFAVSGCAGGAAVPAAQLQRGTSALDGGGDCISCTSQAEGGSGACYAQGETCYLDANCSLLAACVGACTTDTCITTCDNNAGSTAVGELAALTTCDCEACAVPCAAQCMGQDGGTQAGDGGSSGSDGGGGCISCTSEAESGSGACYSQGETCYLDANCSLLAACVGACTTDTCIANCNADAGATAVSELAALTTCDCAACANPCATQCGGQDAGPSPTDAGSPGMDADSGTPDAGGPSGSGHQSCGTAAGAPALVAFLAWVAARRRLSR